MSIGLDTPLDFMLDYTIFQGFSSEVCNIDSLTSFGFKNIHLNKHTKGGTLVQVKFDPSI